MTKVTAQTLHSQLYTKLDAMGQQDQITGMFHKCTFSKAVVKLFQACTYTMFPFLQFCNLHEVNI